MIIISAFLLSFLSLEYYSELVLHRLHFLVTYAHLAQINHVNTQAQVKRAQHSRHYLEKLAEVSIVLLLAAPVPRQLITMARLAD